MNCSGSALSNTNYSATTIAGTGTGAGGCIPLPPPHLRHSRRASSSPLFQFQSRFIHPLTSKNCKPLRATTTSTISCSSNIEKAKLLRRILDSPGVHQGPACFDALSANLVQSAGFPLCFTSGFSISASRLGLPDTGYLSYGEMIDQGQLITQSVGIPVIGDADNGYGNAMNVKRTVKGYISAGFAGIILEDQVSWFIFDFTFAMVRIDYGKLLTYLIALLVELIFTVDLIIIDSRKLILTYLIAQW